MNYFNTQNTYLGSTIQKGLKSQQTSKKSDLNPSDSYDLMKGNQNSCSFQKTTELRPATSNISKPMVDSSKNYGINSSTLYHKKSNEEKEEIFKNNSYNYSRSKEENKLDSNIDKQKNINSLIDAGKNNFKCANNLNDVDLKGPKLNHGKNEQVYEVTNNINRPSSQSNVNVKGNSEKEGILILQRIIFDENDQISFKFNESDNNIVTLALKLKKLFDETKSVNFNQENELRKKNEEITKLKNEIEIVKIDRDQILNELNESKKKNKDLKVESRTKMEENEKLRAKSVMLKEKIKNQESKKEVYYEKMNIDVRAQNKSNPSKNEMLLYNLVPKSFIHLFEKYKDFMLIEKKRGESEKISEMFAFDEYFQENDKNLKFNKKTLEKAKSKISHFRILANDKNSFYRAIGFAYLENLFSVNLNVKKEKQFKNLRIYQLIDQLEEGYQFSLLKDPKDRKQNILDGTETLKNIFIGALLYLFKTKILMEEKNKNQDNISRVIIDLINANSELDIAINVFIRSIISKNSKNPGKEKNFYNEEPNESLITRTVEKLDLNLLIFNSVDGTFANKFNEETQESDPLFVQLFYFADHYDLAYKIKDFERSNKFIYEK